MTPSSRTPEWTRESYERLYLATTEDADYLAGEYVHLVDEQYVEVVEPAWPDERMPTRYEVARVVVSVVFNTVPSP